MIRSDIWLSSSVQVLILMVCLLQEPGWVQTVLETLGPHFQQRKFLPTIAYGSDCSGLDAPFWGLTALLAGIEAQEQLTIYSDSDYIIIYFI